MMHFLLSFVIQTANVLGIFSDPFEFAGDYGPEINTTRQKVFEKVAISETKLDTSLAKIATPEILLELDTLDLPKNEIIHIQKFVEKYGQIHIFPFLRNCPQKLLQIDKILRSKASKEGTVFNLPILNSSQMLEGKDIEDLKKKLLLAVFTNDHLKEIPLDEELEKALQDLQISHFGQAAEIEDFKFLCTPTGQLFLYWLYHSTNFHLAFEQNPGLISEINTVKSQFLKTLGNAENRASLFREKILTSDTKVVFTQEGDAHIRNALILDSEFHQVDIQNSQDGCFVFLRSAFWEPDYKIISIPDYEGYEKGKMNVILAKTKEGENFLLASCHGNSSKAEDGRRQICKVMEQYYKLEKEYPQLQLIIGMDANTKTEEDVKKFRELLDSLGLYATSVGSTTVKQRLITIQHEKEQVVCRDEEDYLIILKPENGGHYYITEQTVGFSNKLPEKDRMLPDKDNPSDHYPVGATLSTKEPNEYN